MLYRGQIRGWKKMVSPEMKILVLKLREQGLGYKRISAETGLTLGAVRNTCRMAEKNVTSNENVCLCCGKKLTASEGRGRTKKFCSDRCRNQFWRQHLDEKKGNSKSVYTKTCAYCGKTFEVYGHKAQKYCCYEHSVKDRYGDNNRK